MAVLFRLGFAVSPGVFTVMVPRAVHLVTKPRMAKRREKFQANSRGAAAISW